VCISKSTMTILVGIGCLLLTVDGTKFKIGDLVRITNENNGKKGKVGTLLGLGTEGDILENLWKVKGNWGESHFYPHEFAFTRGGFSYGDKVFIKGYGSTEAKLDRWIKETGKWTLIGLGDKYSIETFSTSALTKVTAEEKKRREREEARREKRSVSKGRRSSKEKIRSNEAAQRKKVEAEAAQRKRHAQRKSVNEANRLAFAFDGVRAHTKPSGFQHIKYPQEVRERNRIAMAFDGVQAHTRNGRVQFTPKATPAVNPFAWRRRLAFAAARHRRSQTIRRSARARCMREA